MKRFNASIGVRLTPHSKPDLSVSDLVIRSTTEEVATEQALRGEISLALLDAHEQISTQVSPDTMRLVSAALVWMLASTQKDGDIGRDWQHVLEDQDDNHEVTVRIFVTAREVAHA